MPDDPGSARSLARAMPTITSVGAIIALAAFAAAVVVLRSGDSVSTDGAHVVSITVDPEAPEVAVADTLYGLFYEDINHAADGGLYAELVRNRSFEFSRTDNPRFSGLTAWQLGGDASIEIGTDAPLNENNLHYARVALPGAGEAQLRNHGYNTGLPISAGEGYDLSLWARTSGPEVAVEVAVEDETGTVVTDAATILVDELEWQRYDAELTATGTTTAGRLTLHLATVREAEAPDDDVVAGTADGLTIDLDEVSLFPHDTFMGRENGLRRDLAETIAALEPGFLRFPGGCLVNAGSFQPFPDHRARVYDWKDTIGPTEERKTNRNFWGYNHTYGLGYLEYFQFAEDLGAEPVPVVPAGVNGCGMQHRITDPDELDRWVQDTLDLIEFATGGVDTEWGALRAELGRPEPFELNYLGIGNEEYDPQFYVNYPAFAGAIRAAHPDITIIANSGTESGGAVFEASWEFARQQRADMVDEHYYNPPGWFLSNTDRYDDYDRHGPLVMVGEYASQANTFANAVAEAAYMTGLERNADVVRMASYAPLLANVDEVNWTPNLIWFDNHRVYGTSSYHVQRLFGTNRGDVVVPTTLEGALPEPRPITGSIGLASWNTAVAYRNVQVTSADGEVLFADDFTDGHDAWTITGPGDVPTGQWQVVDGELRQMALVEDARAVAGDADWSSYTLSLDARKISGSEGFLIMFGVQDSGTYYWWNLGGWGNTESGIEAAIDGAKTRLAGSDHTIRDDRTYRIRIEVDGSQITTWLDNERVHRISDTGGATSPLYQVVTRDDDTGDHTVKLVNARSDTVVADIDLGDVALADTGTVTTLTAGPQDENSLDVPDLVAPVEDEVDGLGSTFRYEVPGRSVVFIRLSPEGT